MKKQLFFVLIFFFTVFVNNTVFSQYSNATLNGPWFLDTIPAQIYNDNNTNYLVFDGNGNIIDGNMFVSSYSGSTYSVTSSGAISGTLFGSYPFTGQLTSQNYATMTGGGMALSRISNPGALTDSLVGILYTANSGQKNVILRLNNQGQIISSSGLTAPVSGRVYADAGHFEGHIKTGEATTGWDEFTILGAYANDSLIGVDSLNGHGGGAARLKRFGIVTGIVPFAASAQKLIVYPNPASDIVTLNINNVDLTLNIYNVIGTLVKSETLKQNNRQINIGDLSNGVYMVVIKSKDLTENQRLIIQR